MNLFKTEIQNTSKTAECASADSACYMPINADRLANIFFQEWEINYAMKQPNPVATLEDFAKKLRGWDAGRYVIQSHPSDGVTVSDSWASEPFLKLTAKEIAERAHSQLLQPTLGI